MTPREIRAHAERLYQLTGSPCPEQMETVADLCEYALDIELNYRDELTGAELRSVTELLEQLEPPNEKARRARRVKALADAQKKHLARNHGDDLAALLDEVEAIATSANHRQTLHEAGAAARRRQGMTTKRKVLHAYQRSTLPKRERAASIAKTLDISSQYVRRVLRDADVR
jgi:hypothetical protein